MTSPLDDISFKLGELSAGQTMLLSRAEKRDREMAEMKKMLSGIETKLDPVVAEIVWMKPHVTSYSGLRSRAAWLGTLLVSAGGIFGGAASNWLFKKYGG